MNKYLRKAHNRIITRVLKIATKLGSNIVAVGWKKCRNFGDQLTPEIFRRFGLVALNEPRFCFAQAIGTGSILQLVPDDFTGTILGAGIISEGDIVQLPYANILLVRGAHTRAKIGCSANVSIGDPGLIVDQLFNENIKRAEKIYQVGIVPHYLHKNHPVVLALAKRLGPMVRVMNVFNSPRRVVTEIASCSHIFSSSLHGLIVADSLGIPNRWVHLSDDLIGGSFKFRDYYSAYDIEESPIELTGNETLDQLVSLSSLKPRDRIKQVKSDINAAYLHFARCING